MKKLVLFATPAVVCLCAALTWCGCDSDDDGDVQADASHIRGNVMSYSTATAHFAPSPPEGKLQRLARATCDLFIPPALAGVGGVGVSIQNTSHETTTAADGFFVLSGIPPGDHILVFSYNNQSATFRITVPGHASIELRNVRVSDGSVQVDEIKIDTDEPRDDPPDDSGDDASEDSGNDGSSEHPYETIQEGVNPIGDRPVYTDPPPGGYGN